MDKIGNLTILLLILLTVCVISQRLQAETSIYVFSTDQSTVVQTGGFAGVNITYAVTGQFRLSVDSDAGIALFETVDANLADETGTIYGQSLDEIFNMTGLDGILNNKTTIDFKGKTANGTESDVHLTLSFMDGLAHMTGNTTPPPNSADMFLYDVNAVAIRKYAGGIGEPNDPYQIATAKDLMLLGETPEDYNNHFILTADIELDPNLPGRKVFDRAVVAPDTNDVEVGFQGNSFNGAFDGNGYTISHLTIRGDSYLGLFGMLSHEGKVCNLYVEAVRIDGIGHNIGALVGENSGDISLSHSTGTVTGSQIVGGFVGANDEGTIVRCFAICTVQALEIGGGFAGLNVGHASHKMFGWSGNTAIISDCYAVGQGYSQVSGLLVGQNSVENDPFGSARFPSLIENCYAVCNDSTTVETSGLVGKNYSEGDVLNCFWDAQDCGAADSTEGRTPKTTAEMQTASTFLGAGWDFVDETDNGTEDIWSICEGTNYPRFVWQIPVGDFVCPDGVAIEDFSFFMEHWLDSNCDLSNGYCEGTDLDQSGTVDVIDLEIFFENWPAEN